MISRALRCLVVWLLATATLAAICWLSSDTLVDARSSIASGALAGQRFETLLTWLCAALLVGCCLWLWITSTVVVLTAARGRTRERIHGCPDVVRRGVLLACGVAIAGSMALPATAADSTLGGLPLPDRAERNSQLAVRLDPAEIEIKRSAPARNVAQHVPAGQVITVQVGDTLWDIAAHTLGPDPTASAIAERCAAIHELNRGVIGADPDRIFPGQLLHVVKTGSN